MTTRDTEPEIPQSPRLPPRPPKIFDLLGQDILPAQPAAPTPPPRDEIPGTPARGIEADQPPPEAPAPRRKRKKKPAPVEAPVSEPAPSDTVEMAAPEPSPAESAEEPEEQTESAPAARSRIPALLVALLAVAILAVFVYLRPQLIDMTLGRIMARAGGPSKTTPEIPAAGQPAEPLRPMFAAPPPPAEAYPADAVPPEQAELLDKMFRLFVAGMLEEKDGMKPYFHKAFLGLLDPRYGLTEDELRGMDAATAQTLRLYRDFFNELGRNLGKSGTVEADVRMLNESFDGFLRTLEERRQLEISKTVLCIGAGGFGRYEPFNRNEFPVGSLILVYAEVRNFSPRQEPDGRFVARFVQQLVLLSKDGKETVWEQEPLAGADSSLSKKRDYFLVQHLRLPRSVLPGQYTLKVSVKDDYSGETAVSTLPLTVIAR